MIKRTFAWILVILWMGAIYGFSAETGTKSSNRSEIITREIQRVIQKTPMKNKIIWTEFATRKTAHAAEYLILTLLVFYALGQSSVKGAKRYLLTLLIPFAYASLDEFHQSFVSDRGPSVRDVLIDGMGVVTGTVIGSLVKWYNKGKRK